MASPVQRESPQIRAAQRKASAIAWFILSLGALGFPRSFATSQSRGRLTWLLGRQVRVVATHDHADEAG
jgi:hypothetical protein